MPIYEYDAASVDRRSSVLTMRISEKVEAVSRNIAEAANSRA